MSDLESKKWWEELQETKKDNWHCNWIKEIQPNILMETFRAEFPNIPQWMKVQYCLQCGEAIVDKEDIIESDNNACCIFVKDYMGLEFIEAFGVDEEGRPLVRDNIKVNHCFHCGRKLSEVQHYTDYYRKDSEVVETTKDNGYTIQKFDSCLNCYKATWEGINGKCHIFAKLSFYGICNEHQNYKSEDGCGGNCGGCK